jgi:hypothetical protein
VDGYRRPGEGGRAVTALIIVIVAIILGFLVIKLVFGIIKFVLIAAIVIGAIAFIAKRFR